MASVRDILCAAGAVRSGLCSGKVGPSGTGFTTGSGGMVSAWLNAAPTALSCRPIRLLVWNSRS
jgi:hypothetical protein